ncbi:MAG: hypothetical protein RSA12_01235 [Clostridia bacterium]
MPNTIEYAKVFNTELDAQMVPLLVTGWMDQNAGLVKYSGGNEVKIPSIAMDGLGDYDRATGYPEGSVTLAYEAKTLTMDRAQGFNFDAMEVDESNFLVTAGNVMGEFQRTKVIPEVDAYRISKLNALAGSNARNYAPTAASVLKELLSDIGTVRDAIGDNEPLIIMMSMPIATMFSQSTELTKRIDVTDFAQGGVTTRVRSIDGIPILRAPSARMKSKYVFYDGRTASDGASTNPTPNQLVGGFAAAAGAANINWIILHKSAPIAVCKTDVTRVFDPTTYQKANAWHVDYRKFHDLWIPNNRLPGVFVNRKAAT